MDDTLHCHSLFLFVSIFLPPHAALGKSLLTRRMIAPIVALATVVGLGTRELVKPTAARAAVMSAAPAAGPLDDNSVSALLSLDHAMETLAARVTPAIVNVTVTAKTKVDLSDEGMPQLPEGMEGDVWERDWGAAAPRAGEQWIRGSVEAGESAIWVER